MDESGLPDNVRRLITTHLESAHQLEVLLTVRESGDRIWLAEHLSRELRSDPARVAASLRHLAAAGLLGEHEGGYRYQPADRALSDSADALADAYAKRRVRVIELIYNKPDDSIVTLADAFRFRRRT